MMMSAYGKTESSRAGRVYGCEPHERPPTSQSVKFKVLISVHSPSIPPGPTARTFHFCSNSWVVQP